MVVKGKAIVGPILGLVGGILLTIAGLMAFGLIAQIEGLLTLSGLTWADVGFDPMLLYLHVIFTFVWGLLGLIGAIMALTGKKIGIYLMLIFGLVATVGMFIPIGTISLIIPIPVTMNSSMFFVDPILLLLGGILGLVLKEE